MVALSIHKKIEFSCVLYAHSQFLCGSARFDLENRGVRQPVQPLTFYPPLLVFDKTSAQPQIESTWIRCKDWQCVVLREIDFLLKLVIDSLHISPVELTCLNTDMRKFASSQKDESRAQSADSSKAYRKPSWAFNCFDVLSQCSVCFTPLLPRLSVLYSAVVGLSVNTICLSWMLIVHGK